MFVLSCSPWICPMMNFKQNGNKWDKEKKNTKQIKKNIVWNSCLAFIYFIMSSFCSNHLLHTLSDTEILVICLKWREEEYYIGHKKIHFSWFYASDDFFLVKLKKRLILKDSAVSFEVILWVYSMLKGTLATTVLSEAQKRWTNKL